MIKQAHYEWAEPRFHSARRASLLLRQKSSIVAPEHIPVSKATDMPTIAYWYLPFSTLKEIWPELSTTEREQVSKSLGRLLREMHNIKVRSYGLFHDKHAYKSVASFMYDEINKRLKPAIAAKWPNVLSIVNRLLQMVKNLPGEKHDATLVHNDLHLGNILCEVNNNTIRCVGLLDMEEARGGMWESDLASAITLHHPLFSREDEKGDWLKNFGRCIVEGYGKKPDPDWLRFFRVYHLINLGFFSALNEEYKHAKRVGKKASQLLDQS